jgi:hypothetical protein
MISAESGSKKSISLKQYGACEHQKAGGQKRPENVANEKRLL